MKNFFQEKHDFFNQKFQCIKIFDKKCLNMFHWCIWVFLMWFWANFKKMFIVYFLCPKKQNKPENIKIYTFLSTSYTYFERQKYSSRRPELPPYHCFVSISSVSQKIHVKRILSIFMNPFCVFGWLNTKSLRFLITA